VFSDGAPCAHDEWQEYRQALGRYRTSRWPLRKASGCWSAGAAESETADRRRDVSAGFSDCRHHTTVATA